MKSDYGIIAGLLVGLGAIGRFLWRWEKTFTDTAIDELKWLRAENKELRKRCEVCEDENFSLRKMLEPGT